MVRGRHALAERAAGVTTRSAIAPTAGMAKLLGVLVIPVALIATGVTVVAASYSSFTAPTSSPSSNWATGSVALTNDAGSALFTATNLKPGSTGQHCITVSSTGTLPAVVKLYGTGYATTNALASSINLSIVQGTGGSFGSCTGFTPLASGSSVWSSTLAGFSAAAGYGTGVGAWQTAGVTTGSETRTYQITYTVDPGILNTAQSGTASIAFTWEAQNS